MDITDQLDEIIKNIPAPRGYGKPLVKLQYSGDKLDFHVSFTKTRKLKGGVTHDVDSVVHYTAKSVSPQDISGSKLSSRKIVKEVKHPVSSESKKHKCPSRFRRDKMRWEERKRQRIKTKSERKKESQSRFFSHSSSVPHELSGKSADHVESMPKPPIVSAPKPNALEKLVLIAQPLTLVLMVPLLMPACPRYLPEVLKIHLNYRELLSQNLCTLSTMKL